jgi:ketosteroid isomerase-like protein
MDDTIVKNEVWKTVQELNRIWTKPGNRNELEKYFHKDMVAITPSDIERRIGRKSCMEGWIAFAEAATIHSWKETDPLIQIYNNGKTAIVTYDYECQCEMGGKSLNLRGRDMMTLVKEDGRWWLVADQFSPFPGK